MSEFTNPADSRWLGWIGSNPTRTPAVRAASATRARPSVTISKPCPTERPPSCPARHATHLGVVGREARHGGAERRDPVARIRRPLHAGNQELQDRRHRRDADRNAESVLEEQLDVRRVVLRKLEFPETDRVEASGCVGLHILLERGTDRGDLGEGENHERPGILERRRCAIGGFVSSFATR